MVAVGSTWERAQANEETGMRIGHADWESSEQRLMPLRHRSAGLDRIRLLGGEEGSPANYEMTLAWADEGFVSPRHRHNFDQLRYNLVGRMHYGPKRYIHAGEVCYFPEGTAYGPQVQADANERALTMVIQFGGASRAGFMGERQVRAGYDALSALGRFEGGAFLRHDGVDRISKPKLDGYEAIWEYVNGRPLDYPAPRYDEPILMRPDGFAWLAVPDHPGVARRQLGVYGELGLEVAQLGLDDAALPLTADGRLILLFVLEGGLEIDGHPLYKHSAAEVAVGETATLRSDGRAIVLTVGMPRFGAHALA
jgi:hypothetical protein